MNIETFLARLYTDDAVRRRFIASPFETALAHGASTEEATALAAIDPESLQLAARSFAEKRERREKLSR